MTPQKIGRYEIKAQIGRGGMATVYHAFDLRFERDVAIKMLPREFLHDPTFRTRFEREAKTIAALEHSAIVPVHDYGEHESQPYLVMRYMPGGSLADRIQQGPLSLEAVAAIFARVASALDAAHDKGVIHRDVKPSNILFDAYGEAFLSDFGIVKLTEATAQLTGTSFVGTPAYAAPEMARPGGVTSLIDVYALGVTLFQALTGRLPYESDTTMGLMMAHVTEPIPDARKLQPGLPDTVQAVIERAMAKDPTERYQGTRELASRLQETVAASDEAKERHEQVSKLRPALIEATEVVPVKEIEPTSPEEERAPPAASMPAAIGAPPLPEAMPMMPTTPARKVAPSWVIGLLVVAVTLVIGLALGVFGQPDPTPTPEPAPAEEAAPLEGEEEATPEEEPTEGEAPAATLTTTFTNTSQPIVTDTPAPTSTLKPTRIPATSAPAATFPPLPTSTPECVVCPPGSVMNGTCPHANCAVDFAPTGPGCEGHGGPGTYWSCADGAYHDCGVDCGDLCRETFAVSRVEGVYCFADGHCRCVFRP